MEENKPQYRYAIFRINFDAPWPVLWRSTSQACQFDAAENQSLLPGHLDNYDGLSRQGSRQSWIDLWACLFCSFQLMLSFVNIWALRRLVASLQVLQATWIRDGPRVSDPTMYVGMLGTAFLCFKFYETTGSKEDLDLCCEIVDSCATAAETMKQYGFSKLTDKI